MNPPDLLHPWYIELLELARYVLLMVGKIILPAAAVALASFLAWWKDLR